MSTASEPAYHWPDHTWHRPPPGLEERAPELIPVWGRTADLVAAVATLQYGMVLFAKFGDPANWIPALARFRATLDQLPALEEFYEPQLLSRLNTAGQKPGKAMKLVHLATHLRETVKQYRFMPVFSAVQAAIPDGAPMNGQALESAVRAALTKRPLSKDDVDAYGTPWGLVAKRLTMSKDLRAAVDDLHKGPLYAALLELLPKFEYHKQMKRLREEFDRVSQRQEQAQNAPEPELTRLPKRIAAADLAHELGMTEDQVQSFLGRYRKRFPDCYEETENRRKNESRYLYRTDDVLPALLALRKKK